MVFARFFIFWIALFSSGLSYAERYDYQIDGRSIRDGDSPDFGVTPASGCMAKIEKEDIFVENTKDRKVFALVTVDGCDEKFSFYGGTDNSRGAFSLAPYTYWVQIFDSDGRWKDILVIYPGGDPRAILTVNAKKKMRVFVNLSSYVIKDRKLRLIIQDGTRSVVSEPFVVIW